MSALTALHDRTAETPPRPTARVPLDLDDPWERASGWLTRRRYGTVLDPLKAVFHHRPALVSILALEATASRWKKLPTTLQALATTASASEIGCSWCTHRELTEAFLGAARGEVALDQMISVLAPEVVLTTDAGGRAKAARRPVLGPDNVLRFISGVLAKAEVAVLAWRIGEVNGRPALIGHEGERIDCVVWIEIDAGRVPRIDMIRNPDKLGTVRL